MFIFIFSRDGIDLPLQGQYATGILFLAHDSYKQAKESFCDLTKGCDLRVITWRKLKVNSDCLGVEAKKTEPLMRQVQYRDFNKKTLA